MNRVITPNLDTFKETMHLSAKKTDGYNQEAEDLTKTAFFLGLAITKIKEGSATGSFSRIVPLDDKLIAKFQSAANADGFTVEKTKDGIYNKYQIKVAI